MREAFYEESAGSSRSASEAKKCTVLHIVSILFFVLAGFHAMFSFTYVPLTINDYSGVQLAIALIWWFGLLALLVLAGIMMQRWKRRYNVSFDYTFVEDELRVSKVFNGKKRKHIVTLKADQILKIGLCERESYERTVAGTQRKVQFYTPNPEPREGKMMVYILANGVMGKTVYVIECRETMLEYLVRAVGRNKLELK